MNRQKIKHIIQRSLSLDWIAKHFLTPEQRARRILKPKYQRLPDHYFIEPTIRCNLLCRMCGSIEWPRKKPDLDLNLFQRFMDDIARWVKFLTIQGLGEPLLNKDIVEMVRYASSMGAKVRFNSNMTLMTPEMAHRLLNAGIGEITISLESAEPELFEMIRKNASWQVFEKNVRALMQAVKKPEYRKVRINATIVMMRRSLPTIPETLRFLKEVGINEVFFQDMNTDGISENRTFDDGTKVVDDAICLIPPEELKEHYNKIQKTIKELEIKANIGFEHFFTSGEFDDKGEYDALPGKGSGLKLRSVEKREGVWTCPDLWDAPYITADGFVTPCCFKPDQSLFNMGDLKKQSFTEIWQGKQYNWLREKHLTSDLPFHCQGCQRLMRIA